MKSNRLFLASALVLALSLASCTLGLQRPSANPLDAASTIVAQTLAAQGASTSPPPAATISPSPSPKPVTATATTKPALSIKIDNAECRSGPGTDFKLITSFKAGTSVDMVAKDTPDGYWLVKDPASGSSCWVLMLDATAAGSFDLLPEVTPAATAGQSLPAKPGSSSAFNYWEYTCGVGSATVNLHWIDAADNENGYHIYRNGQLIADLPAGSTTYTDTPSGGNLSYSIRAYNAAGESPALSTPSFSC